MVTEEALRDDVDVKKLSWYEHLIRMSKTKLTKELSGFWRDEKKKRISERVEGRKFYKKERFTGMGWRNRRN